jgi:poly(A) polymerase
MPTRHIAASVVKRLQDAGHIAYFAGGWVRDFLMDHPSDDIDIATSASVEEIQALFPKTIPVGVAFGIVIVVQESHQFEVATFRKDRGYIDGRRPSGIEPATPQEDASRRDFTINGMFYDPISKQLFDFVGGQEDIKRKVIRAIGDPHARFAEDRLRMMRAVRYSTRFHFPIEEQTLQAIIAHASQLLPSVAMERVWEEFKKMAQFGHFDTGLAILHRLTLLGVIFPSLRDISEGEMQKRLSAIPHFPKAAPVISQLLELFPSVSLQEIEAMCERLKLSRQEKEFALFLHHAKSLLAMPESWQQNLELIEWARFYAHPSSELALAIGAAHQPSSNKKTFLTAHDERQVRLSSAIKRLRSHTPLLKAEHLMQEGIAPGKQMGLLLAEAERISVNQHIEERATLLQLLKNTSLWPN